MFHLDLKRDPSLIFVVGFDVTRRDTLETCDSIIMMIRKKLQEYFEKSGVRPYVMVVVGNKIDLADKREVTREFAQEHFASMDPPLEYFETSAKTGEGVNKLFESIIRMYIKMKSPQPNPGARNAEDECSSSDEDSSSSSKRCIIV